MNKDLKNQISDQVSLNQVSPGQSSHQGAPSQIPLSFDIHPSTGRDDLIISPSVQAAITIVDQWPNWASHLVILAGPTGSGKSHIANIWQQKTGAIQIVMDGGTQDLVERVKTTPILIEDVDRQMSASQIDETKLFHILNAAKEAGSFVLMTARSWPASWKVDLADLASRIKAATIVEISEPDEMLLNQVIFKLFADRQIEVDEKTVNFLVTRMERSLAVAQKVVIEMDQLALSRKVAVNRSIASEVLARIEAQN